jgi:pimeloyl-ACP methyl ester carboxylesterase
LWHRRHGGRAPRVGIIATHYDIDFSEHYLAEYMADRGYGYLGWNTRFRGLGAYFQLEPALADIAVGIRWMREQAGVETVVMVGNSGGASLMGAYQARAVQDSQAPPADLFISLCAHPGRPDILTEWLDPSVTDETDPLSVDPLLDMFNLHNGPPYGADFLKTYRSAQEDRNHRITSWAKAELVRLQAAGAWDRLFTVHRGWADPRFLDLSLDPSERTAGCYFGDPRRANYGAFHLGGMTTIRSWLAMWSLSESACRSIAHLPRIAQPALVIQSTGDQGCFPSHAQAIFNLLGSADKQIVWLAGDHYLVQPDGARAEAADVIAAWIDARC